MQIFGYDMGYAGLGIAIFGGIVWMVSLEFDQMTVGYVGLGMIVIGGMMFYLAIRKWYCAACGQFLGRGSKPSRPCNRCGSNRFTSQDPGAGDTVRIKD